MIKVNDKVKPLRGRNKDKEGEVRSIYKSGICYVYFGVNNQSQYKKNSLEVVRGGEKKRSKERSGNN